MTQSALLTEFYREYLKWVEEGACERAPFLRSSGLCANLSHWAAHKVVTTIEWDELEVEMTTQFLNAGLHRELPFCTWEEYNRMSATCTYHLHEPRIAWVREHAKL